MEPESSFPRLFTVEEANDLLPDLAEMFEDVASHRDELRAKAPELEPVLRSSLLNGGGRPGSEYGVEAYRLYRAIEKIKALGVVLKDLDAGLIDFPHEREGRVVFLCWRPPEEEVSHWHELDAGYAGRRPL